MKLENQVCSLELAKKLKELGVKQVSYFYYRLAHRGAFDITANPPSKDELSRDDAFSAFTVAELGEMLPVEIGEKGKKRFAIYLAKHHGDFNDEVRYFVEYQNEDETLIQRCADTEADGRAKMLCYLLENKLISL